MGTGQETIANVKARLKLIKEIFQMCAGGRDRRKKKTRQATIRKPERTNEDRNTAEEPTTSFYISTSEHRLLCVILYVN